MNKRDVFYTAGENPVNLGTVHKDKQFYYKTDWHLQPEYLTLTKEQQDEADDIISYLLDQTWDSIDELPEGKQIVFGKVY